RWSNHSVAIEQLQSLVQPSPTPPRPAEALSVPGSQHMAPDLLLHPVFHEAEALAGVSHRKVVHPTAQHRVDQLHDPINRLRWVAAEHILGHCQSKFYTACSRIGAGWSSTVFAHESP